MSTTAVLDIQAKKVNLNGVLDLVNRLNTEVERIQGDLLTATDKRDSAVERFTKKFNELLSLEMQVRELTWCTKCENPIKTTESTLVYIEDILFEGDSWKLRINSKLHVLCSPCKSKVDQKHGWLGRKNDPRAGNFQEKFFVYRAKKDGGRYFYLSEDSIWSRLDTCFHPSKMTETVKERLAKACQLPLLETKKPG